MSATYDSLDSDTKVALSLSPARLREILTPRAQIVDSRDALVASMAAQIEADYLAALGRGRKRVLMIVPVGPVGQYQVLAQRCREEHLSLDKLTILVMDEYLSDDGTWISEDDPLSFRRHLQKNLLDKMPEHARPQLVVPSPQDPRAVGALIKKSGGVDVCYGGVGITGHLAFNDPDPNISSVEQFASLTTRIVTLSRETRLINSVAAAGGNVARIPRMAITVGMKEILSARTLRLYLHRDWQRAAIRLLACGPVTAAFPASLVQRHTNWSLHLVESVLKSPEPQPG